MLGNKGTGREYRDGGCRGGADQFKWEDVKADAYRESYLGHSQFAPVGRWQKGKDILWYTKKHGESKEHITTQTVNPGELARRAEIAAIKAQEEELLNQELGLATKKRKIGGSHNDLDQAEIDALLVRGESTREGTMAERVEGLGAAPAKRHDHVPKLSLAEQEVAKREQAAQTQRLTHSYQGAGTSGGGDSGSVVPLLSKKDMKKEKKREKKERKKEKKERKREKKKAKKAKQASSSKRKDGSSNSSSSSDSE